MTLLQPGGLEQFIVQHPFIFLGFVTWSLVWKGVALWKSAHLSQRNWFIALLVINTAGLLEIIYIFLVAAKKEKARK